MCLFEYLVHQDVEDAHAKRRVYVDSNYDYIITLVLLKNTGNAKNIINISTVQSPSVRCIVMMPNNTNILA